MSFVAISVVVIYFISVNDEILETISSGAFLIGGLLVARNKKLGWYVNMVADTMLAYILFESSDYLFVCFQMLSIYIALRKTIFKPISKKSSEQNSEPFLFTNIFKSRTRIPIAFYILEEHCNWPDPCLVMSIYWMRIYNKFFIIIFRIPSNCYNLDSMSLEMFVCT